MKEGIILKICSFVTFKWDAFFKNEKVKAISNFMSSFKFKRKSITKALSKIHHPDTMTSIFLVED